MDKNYISTSKNIKTNILLTVRVEAINEKIARNNKVYFELLLKDRTGTTKTNLFKDKIDFKTKDVLEIDCSFDEKYENYKILNYKILNEADYSIEDIETPSKYNIEQCILSIKKYIDDIQSNYLKDIVNSFYEDEKIINTLKVLPDSLFNNQKFPGGTLIKQQNILENSLKMAEIYSTNVNKDLIISSSLLLSISKYLEFKESQENPEEYLYTDIGSLIESYKISLYKIMEQGKNILLSYNQKIDNIEKEIEEFKIKIEEIQNAEITEENINNIYSVDSYQEKIKQNKDLIIQLKEENKNNNLLLLKLNHIISTQNYYFNEKESTAFPKTMESQIISMAVYNNYKLTIFEQEYSNMLGMEVKENSIYSNKLNKFIFIK